MGEAGIDLAEAREHGILGIRWRGGLGARLARRRLERRNRAVEEGQRLRHELRRILPGALRLRELDPALLDEKVSLLRVGGDRLVTGGHRCETTVDLLGRLLEHRGPAGPGGLAACQGGERGGTPQRKAAAEIGRGGRIGRDPVEDRDHDIVHPLFGERVEEPAGGRFGIAAVLRPGSL